MIRSLVLTALLSPLLLVRLPAQEPAAAPAAAPAATAPGNQPSGRLTPPPDTAAPAPAAPAATPAAAPAKAPATTDDTTLSGNSDDAATISRKEQIYLQNRIYLALQALTRAQNYELARNYGEARKDFLFAADTFGEISRSTENYARSAEGLTRIDFILYDAALKIADTNRAKQLIDEVIKYNPNNKMAKEREDAINKALSNPTDTSLFGNQAMTPGFVENVDNVQQLFIEAEQFRRTGQWDLEEDRLKHILAIDKYNISATKMLDAIVTEKDQYYEAARLQSRQEYLRQVEEKWYDDIEIKDSTTSSQEAQPILGDAHTTFDIDQRLKSTFISVNYTNASIEEATKDLTEQSKRLDPEHKGINFLIQPTVVAKPITLNLSNLPMEDALRYICQLANVKYKVQSYAIAIVPINARTDEIIRRTFNVPPSFVAPPSTGGVVTSAFAGFGDNPGGGAAGGGARPLPPTPTPGVDTTGGAEAAAPEDPVRAALEAKGVKFPDGADASYTASTGQLIVHNTAEQMEYIEALVDGALAPTIMVKVSTKFVEINQNDLNDLTVNTALNFWNPIPLASPPNPPLPTIGPQAVNGPVTNNPLTISRFSTQLPGSLGFNQNSVDNLINPPTNTYSAFYFRNFLNGIPPGGQFNAVIAALEQKKSYDLLTEPYAITKSGEQAVLEAVQVFPYPTAFDQPQLQQNINGGGPGGGVVVLAPVPPAVIPSFPTDFKKRNVGVRLVVRPQVAADNRTIDLDLFPEVTDFEGFINYGSPINVANPDGTTSLLAANQVNQPVFNTRRIKTRVQILDGSTLVLGGLIRDDVQSVNDNVPILSSLPLVGRLFQSKAITTTKRNLIIFVTATIYRNDGERLNQEPEVDAADVLTGNVSVTPVATP